MSSACTWRPVLERRKDIGKLVVLNNTWARLIILSYFYPAILPYIVGLFCFIPHEPIKVGVLSWGRVTSTATGLGSDLWLMSWGCEMMPHHLCCWNAVEYLCGKWAPTVQDLAQTWPPINISLGGLRDDKHKLLSLSSFTIRAPHWEKVEQEWSVPIHPILLALQPGSITTYFGALTQFVKPLS